MDSDGNVIDSRLASALFPNASASPEAMAALGQFEAVQAGVPFMSRWFEGMMNRELDWFKSHQGGLWVGGKAILSAERLTFKANRMNEALHSAPDQLNWSVSLTEIAAVQVRRRIFTDIIDVRTRSESRSVRCYRAKAFAAEIEQARLAQNQEDGHA